MTKKSVLFLGISIFFFFSCGNQKKRVMTNKVAVEAYLDISFVDQNGNDLLNPDNPAAYKVDNFRLYFIENGKKKIYFQRNLDNPYGCSKVVYYPSSGLYRFRIFPPADSFYLQLSNNSIDTIKSPYKYEENGSAITIPKIWYNGKLVWENGVSKTERYIIIHKRTK